MTENTFNILSSVNFEDNYEQQMQNVLHSMFHNISWIEDNGVSKKLRITTYCLYFYGITVNQLNFLNYIDDPKSTTSYTYLSRMVSSKAFKSTVCNLADGSITTFFYPSIETANWCINELSILAERDKTKKHPWLSTDCLTFYKKRFNRFVLPTNILHFISIRDLAAFMLSQSHVHNLSYRTEVGVTKYGDEIPIDGNFSDYSQISFKSDAILRMNADNNSVSYYLEQDTNKQRTSVIQNKLLQYISTFESSGLLPQFNSILFCIFTNPQKTRYNSEGASASTIALYERDLMMIIWILLKSNDSPFLLSDVVDLIYQLANNVGSTYFKNMGEYYRKQILSQDPNITIKQCFDYYGGQGEKVRKQLIDDKTKRHRISYNARRKTIFKECLKSEHVSFWMLRGLSICTSHNYCHSDVFPFVDVQCFSLLTKIHNMFCLYGIIPNHSIINIDRCSPMIDVNGLVLKNDCTLSNGNHFYVENISDDCGGFLRVSTYLERLMWSCHGYLICLVADDDIDRIGKFYLNTAYATYVSKQQISPLKVFFLSYQGTNGKSFPYQYNTDGSLTSFTP